MELVADVINNQLYLYLPVALVLVGAILVFTFGFKSPEQPAFDKLLIVSEDKKTATKKRKPKDKKVSVNGSAVAVADKVTKEKQSSNKDAPTTPKTVKSKDNEKKKLEVQKSNKSNSLEDHTNKKNAKTKPAAKPVDFDEGNWETVPTKNDKKTKKQDSPTKKPKKSKNVDNENFSKDINQNNGDAKENIKKIAEEAMKEDDVKGDIPVVEEKEVEKEKDVKIEKEVVIQAPEVESTEKVPDEIEVEQEIMDTNDLKPIEVHVEPVEKGGLVFDELGDVLADTKAVKKSKKKARRDN